MNKELQRVEHLPPAVAPQKITVAEMYAATVAKGITAENAVAVREMAQLMRQEELWNAEKAFAAAFNALQSEMPAIQATQPVPNNDGSVRYKFAPFEKIMEQVRPYLQKHKFTVSFSTKYSEGRVIKYCTLQHAEGHAKTNEFAVRIGSGPPKANEAQADGAAATYAKRGALCDALNIVVEHDTDARLEGAPIGEESAANLRERVKHCKIDEAAFLKYAGAKTFEEISSVRFQELSEYLDKKEPQDPLRPIQAKLWEIAKPIRGSETKWDTTEGYLVTKKILKPGQKIKSLTKAELEEVIDKLEITLSQR